MSRHVPLIKFLGPRSALKNPTASATSTLSFGFLWTAQPFFKDGLKIPNVTDAPSSTPQSSTLRPVWTGKRVPIDDKEIQCIMVKFTHC